MIIDAKNVVLGRLSSFAAKQLLLGEEVDIVNCEEAVVSGKKAPIIENYVRRVDRKAPTKGPYLYRNPAFFVKKTIRGMLPFKKPRGQEVYRNVKCHIGVPEAFRNEKFMTIKDANAGKLQKTDYLKVKDICRQIGYNRG